jgi:hypothetical protein
MSASQASKAAATRSSAGKCEAHGKILLVHVTALLPVEWFFEAHGMKLFLCRDVLFVLGIHSVELE